MENGMYGLLCLIPILVLLSWLFEDKKDVIFDITVGQIVFSDGNSEKPYIIKGITKENVTLMYGTDLDAEGSIIVYGNSVDQFYKNFTKK